MLDRDELTLNNSERKLLWGIYQTLQEINEKLIPTTVEQTTEKATSITEYKDSIPLRKLKRNDLMALIKDLPDHKKPDGWSKFTNAELIELLEREGV